MDLFNQKNELICTCRAAKKIFRLQFLPLGLHSLNSSVHVLIPQLVKLFYNIVYITAKRTWQKCDIQYTKIIIKQIYYSCKSIKITCQLRSHSVNNFFSDFFVKNMSVCFLLIYYVYFYQACRLELMMTTIKLRKIVVYKNLYLCVYNIHSVFVHSICK